LFKPILVAAWSKEWVCGRFACWDCGFESRRVHGWLSLMSVVCCQGLLIIEASPSHSDTLHSVALLWTSDQSDAETSTWQHTTLTRDRHPCSRRDSYPQSQKASGRRPTPYTARPLGSASYLLNIPLVSLWGSNTHTSNVQSPLSFSNKQSCIYLGRVCNGVISFLGRISLIASLLAHHPKPTDVKNFSD
jgi:hypothetical protein